MILKAKPLPKTMDVQFYEVEIPVNVDVWVQANELMGFLEMAERTRSRWLAALDPKFVRRSDGGRDPKVEVFEFSKLLYDKFLASVRGRRG